MGSLCDDNLVFIQDSSKTKQIGTGLKEEGYLAESDVGLINLVLCIAKYCVILVLLVIYY
ncbi:hypothetical protein BKI52_33330 [marine bacterium AO1-C]|nr:hypothetical protein BKI52_33330 [marine bacterium AO1-C]